MKTLVLPTNTSIFDHIARRPFSHLPLIGRRYLQADNLSKDDTLVKTACLPPRRSTSIEHVVHSNLSLFPKSALLFQILCEFEFCWSVLVHVHVINIINEYELFWKYEFFSKIIDTTPIVQIHNMFDFSFSSAGIRASLCGCVRVGVIDAVDKASRHLNG